MNVGIGKELKRSAQGLMAWLPETPRSRLGWPAEVTVVTFNFLFTLASLEASGRTPRPKIDVSGSYRSGDVIVRAMNRRTPSLQREDR